MYNVYISLYTLYTLQSMLPGVVLGGQQPVHTSLLPAPCRPTAVIYEEDTNERWQFGDNMVICTYRKYEIYINISWITRPFHRSKIVPIADFITRPGLTGRPDWLRVANTSSHILSCLELFGAIKTNLELLGPMWTYLTLLDLFAPIRRYLEKFGAIWNYLNLIGTIWSYLKHRENLKMLPFEHLIGCQCIKLFLLVTINHY